VPGGPRAAASDRRSHPLSQSPLLAHTSGLPCRAQPTVAELNLFLQSKKSWGHATDEKTRPGAWGR